jgi:hypothetical protein
MIFRQNQMAIRPSHHGAAPNHKRQRSVSEIVSGRQSFDPSRSPRTGRVRGRHSASGSESPGADPRRRGLKRIDSVTSLRDDQLLAHDDVGWPPTRGACQQARWPPMPLDHRRSWWVFTPRPREKSTGFRWTCNAWRRGSNHTAEQTIRSLGAPLTNPPRSDSVAPGTKRVFKRDRSEVRPFLRNCPQKLT